MSQANLTNANFDSTALAGATSGTPKCRERRFSRDYLGVGGITLPQLYTTASYVAYDLTGINLSNNNFAGANFAGQNLTNAVLSQATLSGSDFSRAILANASLSGATLNGASFAGAEIRGASFSDATSAQLYATASYQAHDLTGVGLNGSDLTGWIFAGQNLTNVNFSGTTLTAADFSSAHVERANLSDTTSKGFTAARILLHCQLPGPRSDRDQLRQQCPQWLGLRRTEPRACQDSIRDSDRHKLHCS